MEIAICVKLNPLWYVLVDYTAISLHLVALPDGAIIGLSSFGVIFILIIAMVILAVKIYTSSKKSQKTRKIPEIPE